MKFDQYVQDAKAFVKEIASELGNPEDTDHAYRVMTSVLHTLRDILTPEESLHLISQLPMFLKAVYVDGWNLHVKDRIRSMPEFLECLREKSGRTAARDLGDDETARQRAKAVFRVLRQHVTTGEVQDVIDQFPMDLAELWITEARERAER